MDRSMHTCIGVTPPPCVLNKRRTSKRLVASASSRKTVRRFQKRNGTPPIRILSPEWWTIHRPPAGKIIDSTNLPDVFDTDTSGTANDCQRMSVVRPCIRSLQTDWRKQHEMISGITEIGKEKYQLFSVYLYTSINFCLCLFSVLHFPLIPSYSCLNFHLLDISRFALFVISMFYLLSFSFIFCFPLPPLLLRCLILWCFLLYPFCGPFYTIPFTLLFFSRFYPLLFLSTSSSLLLISSFSVAVLPIFHFFPDPAMNCRSLNSANWPCSDTRVSA